MPHHLFIKAVALTAFVLVAKGALAQAPIQFVNTQAAVLRYEFDTLETLRDRCQSLKADTLQTRPEAVAMANGYLSEQSSTPGKPAGYSLFGFDQDTRAFFLIDGQPLGKASRLTLQLALPRDYARCRIVRSSAGSEMLEVVHFERNSASDVQTMQRLLQDSKDMNAQVTAPVGTCAPGPSQVKALGKVLPTPCHDSGQAQRARMDRVVRKVFER